MKEKQRLPRERMLEMELPGCRRRAKPRYTSVISEDMETAGVTKTRTGNKQEWRLIICGGIKEGIVCCGNPE